MGMLYWERRHIHERWALFNGKVAAVLAEELQKSDKSGTEGIHLN